MVFTIYLLCSCSASASSIPDIGLSYTHTFTTRVEGRYVTLSLPGKKRILTLCEVEVYGYPAPTGDNLQHDPIIIKQGP